MRAAALALAIVASLITSAWAEEQYSPTQRFSQTELLKNWALTPCLANIMTDEKDKKDALKSASAYFEFSRLPVEDFVQLRELALDYAGRKYGGSIPGDFNTMKCVDLFYSDDLNNLVAKLTKGMK